MSTPKKMILLQSSDNKIFELEEAAAMESMATIKNLIEDDCTADGSAIPLPNVSGKILEKVIEYCRRHARADAGAELEKFNARFLKVDEKTLYEILLAANYLNMKGLLDLTCYAVADVIKEKSVEEVRRIFGVTNDFSPEEERELLKEEAMAFQ